MEGNNSTDLFAQFLQWEKASKDTIDFKKIYVDMADDLIAGLVLSQIIYWYLPNKNGVTKLTVSKDGELWIAKARKDWWDEVRVRPRELDRALKTLREKQLVFSQVYLYKNTRTLHVRLNRDTFVEQFQAFIAAPSRPLPKSRKRNLSTNSNHEIGISKSLNSNLKYIESETTSKTTEDSTNAPAFVPSSFAEPNPTPKARKTETPLQASLKKLEPIKVVPRHAAPPKSKPALPKPTVSKQDLIFEWVCSSVLCVSLEDVKADKHLRGRANVLTASIKSAIQVRSPHPDKKPTLEVCNAFAPKLPGMKTYWQKLKPGMSFPTGNGTFATFNSQWFEAGCINVSPAPFQKFGEFDYDPNCPLKCIEGSLTITDEHGERLTRYCPCKVKWYADHGIELK